MTNIDDELDEQIEPIKPKFLDLIENHWASEDNPRRIGIFIRKGHRTGRLNPGQYLELTDGKRDFWQIGNRKGHKMVIIGNLIAQETTKAINDYQTNDEQRHIASAVRLARAQLYNLYGAPICENLHHPKKWQHKASDDCPVVQRIAELQKELDND